MKLPDVDRAKLPRALFTAFCRRTPEVAVNEDERWQTSPAIRKTWAVLATMFLDYVNEGNEREIRDEAERLLRFVANADLSHASIAEQRERRERVHAMQRALRSK